MRATITRDVIYCLFAACAVRRVRSGLGVVCVPVNQDDVGVRDSKIVEMLEWLGNRAQGLRSLARWLCGGCCTPEVYSPEFCVRERVSLWKCSFVHRYVSQQDLPELRPVCQ